MRRIAIGGSSANPPHIEHRLLEEDVLFGNYGFSDVIWIPCGEREDKHFAVCPSCQIDPQDSCHECANHRIAMTEMTVGDLREIASPPNFSIWYDDMFKRNTPTIIWLKRLAKIYPEAEITWVTGSDSIVPREEFGGQNEIQARWEDGEKMWQSPQWHWLVYRRAGYPVANYDFPQQVQLAELPPCEGISSSLIRRLIAQGESDWERMVTREVARHIKNNSLYGWKGKS